MTVLHQLTSVNTPDRGQPVITFTDPDWLTVGNLPFLQNWIDPTYNGAVVRPAALDQFGGDTFTPVGAGPTYVSSLAAFAGRPALDLRASAGTGTLGLQAVNTPPTNSYSVFMAIAADSTLATTGATVLLKNFSSGTASGAVLQIRNRSLGFAPNWTANGNALEFYAANNLIANGAHIVGVSYDDTTSTASLYVDSLTPVATFVTANKSGNTASTRWLLGGGACSPVLVGDLVIFSSAIGNRVETLTLLFQRLKARIGLS